MKTIFIEYPTCSTCRKAKKYLEAHDVTFEDRHIVEQTPTVEELKTWITVSTASIDKLFNTSGQVYRSLELKSKLSTLSDDEKFALLASNGMLIKRPLLIHNDKLLIGFKEEEWQQVLHA